MMAAYKHLSDGTLWPQPGERISEIGWKLRYGEPTRSELLVAASVLDAYRALIYAPVRRRMLLVRDLRHQGQAKRGEGT